MTKIDSDFDKYINEFMHANSSTLKYLSRDKSICLVLYDFRLMYKELLFYNFSILMNKNESAYKVFTVDKNIYFWEGNSYTLHWDKNDSYCMISISVRNEQKNIWFNEAKLIIDIKNEMFTVFPLAGARNYEIKFKKHNKINISVKHDEYNIEYIEILDKTTDLNIFKWLPLQEISKAGDLFYSGYFGDVVGYINKLGVNPNIHFKGSNPEWPYEDL